MWPLADQDRQLHFPLSERSDVPTEYCCIFGISHPNSKFAKYSPRNIQGQNYSNLVATGPNHRIYWLPFKTLPRVVHGLYDKIPRYTDEQKDALAAEHANDLVSDRSPLASFTRQGQLRLCKLCQKSYLKSGTIIASSPSAKQLTRCVYLPAYPLPASTLIHTSLTP